MTNDLTVTPAARNPSDAPRSRASIQLDARAAARAHAMPRYRTRARRDGPHRRVDFEAALLALIFAVQFAATALGFTEAIAAAREPHVDGAATVASAHGEAAP